MQATLTYIGRVLSLAPAVMGRQFEDVCYVERTKQEPASLENGWQAKTIVTPCPNFWYEKHHESGELLFWALSGYGPRIEAVLRQAGVDLKVVDELPCGLGEPDFSAVEGTQWRGSQADVVARICASRNGVIKCSTGWGKCVGVNTPIMRFDGTVVPAQDVKVGDLLMGPDSRPRTVLSTCRGRGPLYRVTPTKGDSYVVNGDHILSLKITGMGKNRSKLKTGQVVNISVSEYLGRSARFKHVAKGWRTGVNFSPREAPPVSPYLFGAWLGDGDSHRFAITSMDTEVVAAVYAEAETSGLIVSVYNQQDTAPVYALVRYQRAGQLVSGTHGSSRAQAWLSDLGVVKNKHVPELYRLGSRQTRLELLAGIIDTDGHYDPAFPGYNIVFKSERLIDDVIFVARSLGFAAYKAPSRKQCVNNGVWGDYWRCSINGAIEQIPCRVPRKQAGPRRQKKDPLVTGITVEPIGVGDYAGFELDGDHLFLLGDFTVTHNSFVAAKLAKLYPRAKIVITVNSIDVARDIYKGMREWDGNTGFVGDGQHNVQRVTVAVTHSLRYCDREFTNLLLGDECHTLAAESFVSSLGEFRRAKFIGFSASPTGRSDGADGMVEALFGPIIADVPYAEAVASGNVVPIEVFMFSSSVGPNVQSIENKTFKDKKGIWTNHARNQLIARTADFALQHYGVDEQILIMVDKTEHAFRLQQLMPDYVVVSGPADPASVLKWQASGAMQSGQVLCTPKDRRRHQANFESGKLKKVISTFVWSKGVNFQDLRILIRADGLASPIQSTQVPGRLSRLGSEKDKAGGVLIDFYDSFSPDLERRSKNRLTEYRRHGWTIKRL